MKISRIILSYIFILFTCNCSTNLGTGIIAGGILGAGSGGLMGKGQGALIGSAVGVIGGTIIGAVLDDQDRKVMERSSPRTVDRMDKGEPLTINDVIKLNQSGINDDLIIQYMRQSNSIYHLSQSQIRRMQDAGVSQRIVNFMVDSGQ